MRRAERRHLLRLRRLQHVRHHVPRCERIRRPAGHRGDADVPSLPRAVRRAGLGMEAVGVPSDFHEYDGQEYYDVREVGARTKDFFQVLAKVPATEVDAPVSLDGSGDASDEQMSGR